MGEHWHVLTKENKKGGPGVQTHYQFSLGFVFFLCGFCLSLGWVFVCLFGGVRLVLFSFIGFFVVCFGFLQRNFPCCCRAEGDTDEHLSRSKKKTNTLEVLPAGRFLLPFTITHLTSWPLPQQLKMVPHLVMHMPGQYFKGCKLGLQGDRQLWKILYRVRKCFGKSQWEKTSER